ncbi:Chlorophyllase enzyme [Fibrobacter sp. UWR3]|uniref:poly(ethylene terephthalate) hydrolase family protein n=1 Tax=Fibrobacter sp. UWR3 TaxID=1896217 RepID=UPI00092047C9|nr:esterase [Fibrobacter sp. UWR3]SHN10516.1 Chlorophyllase enzyme [Fibrobacter sp. UWR3]
MKSRFFRNLAKGLVVVSAALAVVNCDESTVAAAQQQYDPNDPLAALSSSGMADPAQVGDVDPTLASSSSTDIIGGGEVDPWADPCVASSLPDACGPGTNPLPTSSADVNPASSADVNPASSADVAPVSSAVVENPASSSSEAAPVVSSSSEDAKPAVSKIFLANDKEEEKNYMEVEYKTNTGWDGEGILAYPKRLTDNPDQKHAVVVWGPGGGTKPSAYEGMIRRLASHGFVVVALKESPGNATQAIKALDWLDGLNKDSNSPLFGKLDMNTVGCSGHSMGGLESEQALIKDRRVLTAFLNNSGDWGGAGAMKVATDRTIAILYGEGGMERGNAENDYNNANVKAPACLIQMTGGKGTECYEVSPGRRECGYGHGSGSWDGMAATVAWMRWHLGGEEWRKADFVGTSGKYIDGNIIGKQGNWKTQCKNF